MGIFWYSICGTFNNWGALEDTVVKEEQRLLIPVVGIVCLLSVSALAQYGGGTGGPNNPYLIYTAEQMNEIGLHEEHLDKHFRLMADIDLGGYTGQAFNLIGYVVRWNSADNRPFTGVFDGNGHTISNFNYTSTNREYVGLFRFVKGEDAIIKNLGLIAPNVDAGTGGHVAALVASLRYGTVTNCYVDGGSISGQAYVGALLGEASGTITNCYSTGSVSASNTGAGGLVGALLASMTNCYSTCNVTGQGDVGGLVGENKHATIISNCYSTGSVTGQDKVGGLVGYNRGEVVRCYSTGSVTGTTSVGGLAGLTSGTGGIITHSFWDIETSGQSTSSGGTGKTTVQMQTFSMFDSAGYDFWNVWIICEQMNSPVFFWQIPVGDFLCPDGVDFIDFAYFAARWGQNNCNQANYYCGGTDLDRSSTVDTYDLEIFCENWLKGMAP